MAMENKRITQLSTERLTLTSGDYVMVDDADNGSAKYRLDRLKETDTTLSVSGKAADAAATGQAISDEAEARENADNALGEDISDLKSALSYKVDKVYGGATSNTAIELTGGKTWHSTLGTMVNGSKRAAGGPVEITPDMKSISVTSGYAMFLYGNNDGVGHALSSVSSWSTAAVTIENNIQYKYLFVMIAKSSQADFTPSDDLSNVVNITKYNAPLDFALDSDLDALDATVTDDKTDLFVAEKTTGFVHLDLHKANIINSTVYGSDGVPSYNGDTTRACTKDLIPVIPNIPIYFTRPNGYFNPLIYYFKNGTFQGYDTSFTSGKSYDADAVRFLFFKNPNTSDISPQDVESNFTIWQETSDSYKNRLGYLENDLFDTEKAIGVVHIGLYVSNLSNKSVLATNGAQVAANSTRVSNIDLIPIVPNTPIYYTRPANGYFNPVIYYFKNEVYQGYDTSFTSGKSYDADAARFLFFKNPTSSDISPQEVASNFVIWQEAADSYNKRIDALEDDVFGADYISCWGDSLTSMAGWIQELATLSGMTAHNCGVGGEGIEQISARQGADAYIVEGVTIPADTTAVTLTTNAVGFKTQLGKTGIKPNFTTSVAHFNPCKIGDIVGTLVRNGTGSSDTITFTRTTAGEAVTITRPETIRTNADMNWNAPYLMVIWMGQNNFGYDNDNEITGTISEANIKKAVEGAKLMMAHTKAKNVLVLGIATGDSTSNAAYEEAMQEAFGRYFLSIRQYLVHPVYDGNNAISTCYGLQDLSLTPTAQDLTDIAAGKVPSRCFMDGIHFVEDLRPFIGDAIYKRCKELNIF